MNNAMSNMNSGNESCEDLNELIIHYVKSCSEIWDIKNKHYKDNNVKNKKWAEIARELNVPDDFVKSRWRSIRDRYIKEKKKLLTKSGQAATKSTTWSLMPHLEFLTETVEARQTISNLQDDNVQITQVFTPSQYIIPIQSTVSSIQSTSSSTQNCEVEISTFCFLMVNIIDSYEIKHLITITKLKNFDFEITIKWDIEQKLVVLNYPKIIKTITQKCTKIAQETFQCCNSNNYFLGDYMKSSSSQQNRELLTPILTNNTPYISSNSPSPVLRNLNSPCSSTASSSYSSLMSRPPSTSPCPSNSSRAKKRKSESLDPVDEAILNITSEKTKRDSLSNFTSDDLFYLSISRDTQQLNIRDKMRLKQTVLNTLSEILSNNSIIE
ncbi:uncharacterized protein LOC105827827 isoform X1 [Monomorium pharaonis]|uniref:uncharacterized protein LOC105827837 isoform X1 n=1 Tax=Monomorium pharaonis TaxID=307658 RepID=UPI0017461985|nr:uncharacterized protein LOC105827837 isoform X1 [Monomorium pharaonis]XP_036140688.1 uncharacterized protein LOC105830592 isoform X1 [Monomorium pharaonis]XP_036147639.1 uncharacterized protein LOC118644073 isoform X1 [Monomorium pharaonis]XP_036149517.1 uncharacterized protein LOC105827827 isoform X1 [Monomorium pharaonis]